MIFPPTPPGGAQTSRRGDFKESIVVPNGHGRRYDHGLGEVCVSVMELGTNHLTLKSLCHHHCAILRLLVQGKALFVNVP